MKNKVLEVDREAKTGQEDCSDYCLFQPFGMWKKGEEPFNRLEQEKQSVKPRDMLDKALKIACKAHVGQVDKGGEPYIFHPIRVALHCRTEEEKIVALLHDVVEDTSVTLDDLREEEFPEEVIKAVRYLTKKEGEDYREFIRRVACDDIALQVKMWDLEDNMDESRLGGRKHWKLETYREAYGYLQKKLMHEEG